MRTTETQISNLIKTICELTGKSNNMTQAIERGHETYLSYENAACYGGYRLISIGIKNGAHYGAFNWGSTEPRLKPAAFAERLEGLIAGLEAVEAVKSTN